MLPAASFYLLWITKPADQGIHQFSKTTLKITSISHLTEQHHHNTLLLVQLIRSRMEPAGRALLPLVHHSARNTASAGRSSRSIAALIVPACPGPACPCRRRFSRETGRSSSAATAAAASCVPARLGSLSRVRSGRSRPGLDHIATEPPPAPHIRHAPALCPASLSNTRASSASVQSTSAAVLMPSHAATPAPRLGCSRASSWSPHCSTCLRFICSVQCHAG
jgi:hypothetical protein